MYPKILSLLAVTVLLFGCAQKPSATATVTEITIESTEFGYAPASITVSAGQPVVLTIHNNGEVEHDFVIEDINVTDVVEDGHGSAEHDMHDMEGDYDLHVSTQKGQTSTLKFTALKPGTYQIFCSVAGHLELGMVGTLIVE
jgi:uncharacterized cupredoxin-like copper-binding protein